MFQTMSQYRSDIILASVDALNVIDKPICLYKVIRPDILNTKDEFVDPNPIIQAISVNENKY